MVYCIFLSRKNERHPCFKIKKQNGTHVFRTCSNMKILLILMNAEINLTGRKIPCRQYFKANLNPYFSFLVLHFFSITISKFPLHHKNNFCFFWLIKTSVINLHTIRSKRLVIIELFLLKNQNWLQDF